MLNRNNTSELRNVLAFCLATVTGLAISFSYFTHIAHGQTFGGKTAASIDVRPMYPEPGDTVRLTLNTNSLNESTSLITWTVNGENVLQSYGADEYTFIAGDAGSTYKASVQAVDTDKKSVQASTFITVGSVSFAWEGDTYTHPYFRGRALQSEGAGVTVMAIPTLTDSSGELIDADELFYEWQISNNTDSQLAGRGNMSVTINPQYGINSVGGRLIIKDSSGATRMEKSFTVPQSAPRVIFYEDNPLYGIRYDHAVMESHTIYGSETALIAEPYHVTAENRNDETLAYEWEVGDVERDFVGRIVLRPESGAGSTDLTVALLNTDFAFQRAQARLTVYFSVDSSTSPNTDAT